MTLLNLKNYFYNLKINTEINNKNKNGIAKIKNNYYCSMFLTSISMIQARLFIQAWEMLTNLQNEILSFNENILEKNKFLKIMFEIKNNNSKNLNKEKRIYLTKLELIKAICMLEHGHIQICLDCLKNCIDIYYFNKYSFLNKNISLNKINEIAQDKIHIQTFLSQYGNQIVDILINFLRDKNEIILYTLLKIFEFFIDYNPVITFSSVHKLIDFLSKISYTIDYNKKNSNNKENNNEDSIYQNYLIVDEDENNNIINNNENNENKLQKIMKEKGLLFPYDLYDNFKKEQKVPKDNNKNNDSDDSISITNNKLKFNSISQILQKQINYTLDTIIQNISNFDSSVINNILETCSPFLFSIIKMAEKNSLIYICSFKILKKCYENKSSFLYYMNYKNIFNLFLFGIKSNLKDIFKEYIKIQNNIYKNSTDFHTTKKLKENIQYVNMKNNYINTLLNTNAIIENNDFGNLITIIFDRISENYLHDFSFKNLNKNKKKLYGGVDYLSNCIKYIQISLNILKNMKEEENSNNAINSDSNFIIFYLYLILEFLIIIYLPNSKNEIKKALLSFYLGKNSNEKTLLFQNITDLIKVLFDVVQYTLNNLSSYILFEPTLDILNRIKFLYKANNNPKTSFPSYDKYFLPQYELVYEFISKKGITYDNIKYLLKTLPLSDVENPKFVYYFKKIFSIFLLNFDNYYTEESFSLFSLSLEKIVNFIDENLFEQITLAILSKSNYKGKIFNQCYNKYYEIILYSDNLKNFEFLMKKFENSILDYKKEMIKNKGNKLIFKNKYIKFIDRIELIRKFYENIKNNINEKNENEMWKFIIFQQEDIMKIIIDILFISDDTTISKINALILENLLYFDYKNIIKVEKMKNNENIKENEEINSNTNDNNYINNFTIADIGEENNDKKNNNLYSSDEIKFFKNIIINNNYINDYIRNINSKENLYLFKENLKLMNKIISIINNFSNSCISLNEKYNLFTKYYSSINKHLIINSTKIPNLLEDLLLFFYQITIPFDVKENYAENNQIFKDYISILQYILLWAFSLEDNNENINKKNIYDMKIFGIEMILKLFNIKFNLNSISLINKINIKENLQNIIPNNINFTKEEIILIKFNMSQIFKDNIISLFLIFFEKLLKLLDNENYQIFFLIEFLLNLIVPEESRDNFNKIIKSLNINYVWMDNIDDLIDLFNFIKEKIINNRNISNDTNTNNSELIGINLDDDNEKDEGYIEKDIIVDEVNDENDLDNDFNNYVFQGQEYKKEEINIIQKEVNDINGNEIINQINNINNVDSREILANLVNNGNISPEVLDIIYSNTNNNDNNNINNIDSNMDNNMNNINNISNMNNNNIKKDDDDLSLEDLGVTEVDDDIFGENFDESKVPILKKNNVRCKGYAAKFKTNQNSRALLMSDHVRGNNSINNSNNESNNNNSINNNLIIDNNINSINNNMITNINNQPNFPDNNQIIENNANNILININKSNINNIRNGNNIINNSEEKEKTESDFNDAPDLTQKKKNIRPLNGFRPATPPLKDAYTQQNSVSNPNIINIIKNNAENNKINEIINNNNTNISLNNQTKDKNVNKKERRRGKISSISGKHRINRSSNRFKDKHSKKNSNKDRAKSEENIKKVKYEIKGVEIFLRKNKKSKIENNKKDNHIINNNLANIKNGNNINTKKNQKEIAKNNEINNIGIIKNNDNKDKKDKKEKVIVDEDDIIFGEFLKINDNNKNNANILNNEIIQNNENIQNKNNKKKSYQRPSDKERKVPKENNINNNIIKNNKLNKKNQKESNINKNIKKNNVFSSFNEVISQQEFNNNIKNSSNTKGHRKSTDLKSNKEYNKDFITPVDKKETAISFNIKQLVNESFSAKNIKNDNKLHNNFINHSGIYPRNETNNYKKNNNYEQDNLSNKSDDLFYDILNAETKDKNICEIEGGCPYNNFIDKKSNNYLNSNKYRKKGK